MNRLLCILLIACNSNSQINLNSNKVFSYDLLSNDTLVAELLNPEKFTLIHRKSLRLNNESEIQEFHYLLDKELKIKYTKYAGFKSDTSNPFRDKFEILDKSFILDQFFYGADYTNNIEPRKSALNAVYKFNFAHKKYACFFIQDVTNPDAMLNTELFLFDVTNLKQLKLILQEVQASENLKCFGDFNKNNKLDFAFWRFGNDFRDTLNFFELDSKKNVFIKDKDHYIVINDSLGDYYIKKKNCKW